MLVHETWRYTAHAPAGSNNWQMARFCELCVLMRIWVGQGCVTDNIGDRETGRLRGLVNDIRQLSVSNVGLARSIGAAIGATDGETGLIRMRLDQLDALEALRRLWRAA